MHTPTGVSIAKHSSRVVQAPGFENEHVVDGGAVGPQSNILHVMSPAVPDCDIL